MTISRNTRRWCALTYIGLCIGYAIMVIWVLPWWTPLLVGALWLALSYRFQWGHANQRAARRKAWPWSLLPLMLWWVYIYLDDSFGQLDLGAVIFHLQAGIEENGSTDRQIAGVLYTLAAIAMLVAVTWLVRADHRWRLWERVLSLFLLALNPLLFGLSLRGASAIDDDESWLNDHYHPPQIAEAPARPPNLIYLYMESTERTYSDTQRFGDVYEDLEQLGERGVVFKGVQQLDNTGWTMAGMVASQCGVPLMPAGLMHDNQFEPLSDVLPGVNCLGDLLHERGYDLAYMGGASTKFAGKSKFYNGHGFDTVLGRDELEDQAPPGYLNDWGLYDDTLLDLAETRIRRMHDSGEPYAFFGLTLAGHPPFGNPSRACIENQGPFDGTDILYSVKCTGWLVKNFIERLENQGLLDNTLVVVASDHLSMKNSAWEDLIAEERENTLMMLGNGLRPRVIERPASMVDVLPTVLEAMGYEVPAHRAGLGVSLLSNSPTLIEDYSLEEMNQRMRSENRLQERLWSGVN
ncbi:sulfatase-like hydrolase/transferase [Salinicola avicenniae]|uniref:sulfatase-like hydrolase/transferase n=1 Tax=Salinicola avicenniae TaxID=2916836 RepID=UPI002074930B|nr:MULTISPECIES: sulfatase-like hydrolase/transferase [unclassified Salinicola]